MLRRAIQFWTFGTIFAAASVAATIDATSATGFRTKSGTGSWDNNSTSALVTITWSSGDNAADGTQFCNPPCAEGKEPKFDGGVAGSALGGRNKFQGFSKSYGPGIYGSTSDPSGSGSSTIQVCGLLGTKTCGIANWKVTADGTLGKGAAPSWITKAKGEDPWYMDPSDFASFGDSTWDLWVPVGLAGASWSSAGDVQLQAWYETAAGIVDLLSIVMSHSGATVTAGNYAGLAFYQINDMVGNPTLDPAKYRSASQIQSSLNADLGGGDSLNNPMMFGIYVPNLPIPRGNVGDGHVALIHVSASAEDSAAASTVPEPRAWMLVAAGAGLIGIGLARRKASAVEPVAITHTASRRV